MIHTPFQPWAAPLPCFTIPDSGQLLSRLVFWPRSVSGTLTPQGGGGGTATVDPIQNQVFGQRVVRQLTATALVDGGGGGGGGGASSSALYVTTAPDASLTSPRILPYLANYNPDKAPGSPSATNDEFAAGSISGSWTSIGPPVTLDASTYKGYALMGDNTAATVGIYETYAPGAAALTVAVRVGWSLPNGFSLAGLALTDNTGAALATLTVQNDAANNIRGRTGATGLVIFVMGGLAVADWCYLAIQRDNTTNYACRFSKDGINWVTMDTFSQAGTIARCYLQVNGQGGGTAQATFDFVRMFTSQTDVIGAAP